MTFAAENTHVDGLRVGGAEATRNALRRSHAVRLLFFVIIGVWIDGLLLIGGARLPAIAYGIPSIATAVVTVAGEMLLECFGMRRGAGWLCAAFVAGTTLTSIVMLVPTWLLHWSAQSAFLAWSGVVLVAAAAFWRPNRDPSPLAWHEAGIPLLFALMVLWFSRRLVAAGPTLAQSGVLPTWIDYFAHGAIIASFGSSLAIDAGDIMLPGTPRVFYHYGMFMLPAALSPISGLSGLALAASVALPLGLLVGLCGLFALAAELAGTGPALLSVWLMACLPDPSHFLLHNGVYGFHWQLFTSPGSGYAIGTSAVAVLCTMQWFEERRTGPLLIALLLTVMLIMLRVHLFMLLAPALLAAVVLAALPHPWRLLVFASGLLTVSVLSVLLVAGLLGPGAATLEPLAADYITFAFNNNGPPVYAEFLHHLGRGPGILVGALLLVPAALGAWVIAMPLVALWAAVRREFRPVDWLPGLLCITFVLLIVWAPAASNGDIGEYKHRHFVLLYALVAVWTVARFLALAGAARWLVRSSSVVASAAAACCCLAIVLATRHVDAARPSAAMKWASVYYAVSVEPGIPSVADFIRDHARPGDMMAVGGGGADPGLTGPALELVSMTDIPSYVGRVAQAVATRPPAIVARVKRRAADIEAVDTATDEDAALALLRSRGIRWYVMLAPNRPAWDTDGSKATFRAGLVSVYDTIMGAAPAERANQPSG